MHKRVCSLYYKKQDILCKKIEIIPFVIAVLFSVFTLIGLSYTATGNWDFIFKGEKQFFIALFTGTGYLFLCRNLFIQAETKKECLH